MFAFYLACVFLAAGLLGVYGQHELAQLGYAPGLGISLPLALAIGALYAATQVFYLAVIRTYKPTGAGAFYFFEALSQAPIVILLLPLRGASIPWPHERLAEYEPFLLLLVFGVAQALVKIVAFYTALTAPPAARWPGLAWAGLSLTLAASAAVSGHQWAQALEAARPSAALNPETHVKGDIVMTAQTLPEGARLSMPVNGEAGRQLSFYWASPDPTSSPESVHLNVVLEGATRSRVELRPEISASGWTHVQVGPEDIPPGLERATLTWQVDEPPRWQRMAPIQPLITSSAELVVSEPRLYASQAADPGPNLVVIAVDGLGARHIRRMGYPRNTTPNLDRLAASGASFSNVYAPAPESLASVASILTGLNPLQHRFLEPRHGPLPEEATVLAEHFAGAGYATALFTEDQAMNESQRMRGAGLERGFDWIDDAYFPPTPLPDPTDNGAEGAEATAETPPYGAELTLDRLAAWLGAHRDVRSMAFVRLTDIGGEGLEAQHGGRFGQAGTQLSLLNRYDNQVARVDTLIGRLSQALGAMGIQSATHIAVAGTFAYDFSETEAAHPLDENLREERLRVPVILHEAGREATTHDTPRPLSGLHNAALAWTGRTAAAIPSVAMAFQAPESYAVSMRGSPLQLSLRMERWRLTWQSGWAPFEEPYAPASGGYAYLRDGELNTRDQWSRNRSPHNPDIAQQLREELQAFLVTYAGEPASELELSAF